jgi:hypothetical protein
MRLEWGRLDLHTEVWCGNLLGYVHLETAKEMKKKHETWYYTNKLLM